MIKEFCDRCGREINPENDPSTLLEIIDNVCKSLKKMCGGEDTRRPLYYIGVREGPSFTMCDSCEKELEKFILSGREKKDPT